MRTLCVIAFMTLLLPNACVFSSACACTCFCLYECVYVCVCERTGVEILRHVTAGGPMPTGKDEAEKEMTVATATLSWSG